METRIIGRNKAGCSCRAEPLGPTLPWAGGEGRKRRKEALKSRGLSAPRRIKAPEEGEGAKFTRARKEKAEKSL